MAVIAAQNGSITAPMDWDDLKIFLHVARSGQMTSASRALRLDHSTISRRIVRLEEQMKVTLFERAGKRLRITEDGTKLFAVAEKIESVILRDAMNIHSHENAIAGKVRIGTPEGFGTCYLAARLPRLMRPHPDLEVELVALPRNFSLASREVDLAITMDRPVTGSVRFKKLTDLVFGIYGSTRYLQEHGQPVAMEELGEHLWCGYIGDLLFTDQLDLMKFGDTIISPRYRASSPIVHLEAMCAGEVLGVLPTYIARQHPELTRVLPDKVTIPKSYWLAIHDDLSNLHRVQYVKQQIEALVHQDKQMFVSD